MAEASPMPFVMQGARDVVAGGLAHIDEQVKGLEKAVAENPGLAFDLAKTLVESVCKVVLKERNIPFEDEDDLPCLYKKVTQNVPFLPLGASDKAEVRQSLKQTLGGLNTAIHGICELRNRCGFASHGAGEPRPIMEGQQAFLAATAADAIVGFLYNMHRQDRTPGQPFLPRYEKNLEFNTYIDDVYGTVSICGANFRPSEILFQMEPQTYRVSLAEFELEDKEVPSDASTGEVQ